MYLCWQCNEFILLIDKKKDILKALLYFFIKKQKAINLTRFSYYSCWWRQSKFENKWVFIHCGGKWGVFFLGGHEIIQSNCLIFVECKSVIYHLWILKERINMHCFLWNIRKVLFYKKTKSKVTLNLHFFH